jgi:hypothetical protein
MYNMGDTPDGPPGQIYHAARRRRPLVASPQAGAT